MSGFGPVAQIYIGGENKARHAPTAIDRPSATLITPFRRFRNPDYRCQHRNCKFSDLGRPLDGRNQRSRHFDIRPSSGASTVLAKSTGVLYRTGGSNTIIIIGKPGGEKLVVANITGSDYQR